MERYYKALSEGNFLVRLIRIEDSIGEYDAFDLLSDQLTHLRTFILDPKPNIGWEEVSLDEYANILLDTMEDRKVYETCDKSPISFVKRKEMSLN